MPDLKLFLDSCICKHLVFCSAGASLFMCALHVGVKRILFVSLLLNSGRNSTRVEGQDCCSFSGKNGVVGCS